GDAAEANLAVGPGLGSGPLNAIVKVLSLARREVVDEARRGATAARVEAHAGIVVRHPFLRVHHLPALIRVAGARRHVGVLGRHALPGAGIAVLEGEALGIGSIAQDDRATPILDRTEYVAAHDGAVVHGHGHVPIDAHAIAHLGTAGQRRSITSRN